MPVIKSAKRKMKQDVKRTLRNNVYRVRLHSRIKELQMAVRGKQEGIPQKLVVAQSAIDVALKKNLLHKNTAARRKSGLAKMVAAMKA